MDMHTNIGRLARLEPLYGTSRRAYRVYVRVKARTARFKQSDAERERERGMMMIISCPQSVLLLCLLELTRN